MLNLLKLLSLVTFFKDVTTEVQAAGKESRDWYLHRTVWGAILALIGAIAAKFLGVTLDETSLSSLADNIPQFISVAIGIWGSVLSSYGLISKALRK